MSTVAVDFRTSYEIMAPNMTPEKTLPPDFARGTFIGRVWRTDIDQPGPSVVKLDENGDLIDITAHFPTVDRLLDKPNPLELARAAKGPKIGNIQDILANTLRQEEEGVGPYLIAPVDTHVIKAAGVTFAVSMIERVIEEKAKGNPEKAAKIRAQFAKIIGDDLSKIKPGSPQAEELKKMLQKKGWWSQYLEVGIGEDAEIFTKAPTYSAIGHGARAGLHPKSKWNNPEPEVVLIVNSRGEIVGAVLGNDVNLRDFEGRSALLLGEAKDQRGSCVIGPFIRLCDDNFQPKVIRALDLTLKVVGLDGGGIEGASTMSKISRLPEELVRQMFSHHDYPTGAVLFCGTLFAPNAPRLPPG